MVGLALVATALPASAQIGPVLGAEDEGFFDDGLVIGLGLAGAGAAVLVGALYYFGVGGLRHVDKDNVLEHPMRQSLLQVVEDEPGVHLRELANRHGTAVTNTQWHLRKLEMAGLVATRKVQGRRLYYPKEGGIAMREQAVQNAALQNPNARRILECIESNAGINQRTLADHLGMNPGTVRWHLRKMEDAQLLRSVQEGAQHRYFAMHVPARPPRPARAVREAVQEAEAQPLAAEARER